MLQQTAIGTRLRMMKLVDNDNREMVRRQLVCSISVKRLDACEDVAPSSAGAVDVQLPERSVRETSR